MPSTYNPGPAFTRNSPWDPNRLHPIDKVYKPHRGDDWSAPIGTPIPAAATGKVVKNQVLGGYGNLVILEHLIDGQIVHTWYAHLNVPSPLAIGVPVEAGETVGAVGNIGKSTGPHLHFEVAIGGVAGAPNMVKTHPTVDPSTFEFPDFDSEPESEPEPEPEPGLRPFTYEVIDSLGNSHKGTLFGFTDEWFDRMLVDIHEEVLRDNSPENLERLVETSVVSTQAQRPEYLYVYVNPYAHISEDQEVSGSQGKDKLYGNDKNNILDASGGDDYLYGEEGHDFLYGGEGDDILIGGEGVDRLEDGDGKDTYIFDGDFGRDIVVDSDGDGKIIINGVTLSNFEQVTGTDIIYRDDKNNPTFEVITIDEGTSTSLLITPLGVAIGAGTVVIKNWSEGGLGIHLDEPDEEDPDMTGIWTINGNGNDNAISATNYLVDHPTKSLADYKGLSVNAGAGHDVIMGLLHGNDTLLGGDGDDVISGGFSLSLGETAFMLPQLASGTGIDSIDGGKGDDYISVSANGSVAHGGDDNDVLTAATGLYIEALTVEELKDEHSDLDLNEHAKITRDQVWSDVRSMLDFTVSSIAVGTSSVFTANNGKFIGLTPEFAEFTGASSGARFIAKESSGSYRLTYDYSTQDGLAVHGYSPALLLHGELFKLANGHTYEAIANVKGSNLYGDAGDGYLNIAANDNIFTIQKLAC